MAARHRAVAIDFGTGDGAYARRLADADPGLLVIGVDANPDNLRRTSRRAGPNLLLARMALERAPGALEGLADRLTVLLPWGSLLRAVALGEIDGLSRLRDVCAPGAEVEIVFGYGDAELPAAGGRPARRLAGSYAEADLEVSVTEVSAGDVAALPTTWAKRLAHSNRERAFWRLTGTAARRGSALRTGS